MKRIYLIYLKLPKDIYYNMCDYIGPKYILSGFKVYNKKYYIGFYAYTDKKSILKRFLKERNDKIFKVNKVNIDDDDFDDAIKTSKLKKIKYSDVLVISNENEYTASVIDVDINMMEHGPCKYANIDYNIFNSDIIAALDVLSYTTLYDMYNIENIEVNNLSNELLNEIEYRNDLAMFNASFNLSPLGSKIISYDNDEFACFIYLYRYLF